jgi:ABC-type uncharacterized transport system permease subunit
MLHQSSNAELGTDYLRLPAIILAGINVLTGLALASFVLVGFWSAVLYGEPQVQLAIGALTLVVLILAVLGILQEKFRIDTLVSVVGLAILSGNALLRFLYGYDWFEGHWYFAPVQIDYITYAAIAMVFSRRIHWMVGILAPALLYVLTTTLMGSSLWWGYAVTAIACGVVGMTLGLLLKRTNTDITEATVAFTLLAILILVFKNNWF